MAFRSIKSVLADAALATPDQFEEWRKAWRIASENGSQEGLLAFFCREAGMSQDIFLQKLAQALSWQYVELKKIDVPSEARSRISTKVAFQYTVLPTAFVDGKLQIAVSDPFDAGMLSALQFDAGCPVTFALAPRDEIDKALKKVLRRRCGNAG